MTSQTPIRTRWIGIAEILASGVTYGFLGVFGKAAYAQGLTPGETLAFRFVISAISLGIAMALFRPRLLKLERRNVLICSGLGVLGYAVFSSMFFTALQGLSASLTVLLLYTYPVIVTLGAWLWFRERMSLLGWVALPIVTVGLVLLVWGDVNVSSPIYLVFGVGSAVFYSFYILSSRRFLRGVHPFSSVLYIQSTAALALALTHFRDADRLIDLLSKAWLPLLGISWISTILPMILFLSGLQKLKSSEASILSTAEPITGIAAAALLLGERLSGWQMIGGGAVLTAMVLAIAGSAPPRDR